MPKTITITGDSIPLPKRLAKKWRGSRAVLGESGLRILPSRESLDEFLAIMRQVGRGVTRQDLNDALRQARRLPSR